MHTLLLGYLAGYFAAQLPYQNTLLSAAAAFKMG